MAVKTYTGAQRTRPQVSTLTVTTADTGGTITVTVGGTRACVVTPSTTNTTTTASDLVTALQAMTDGEFTELTYSSSGAVVTITGPDDGAPFTISKTDGGSNATTLATTAPLSPHDVGDAKNWSGAALPADGVDSIELSDSAVDMRYNLDALAAVGLVSPGFVRRGTYTGRIGLPTTNANGYPEYRVGELQVKSATYLIEQAGDSAQQIRLRGMLTGSAITLTVVGDGGGSVGSEALEVRGLAASQANVVDVSGGSVAISPLTGQACTVATLLAVNSTVRIGPDATLSGTVSLTDCQAKISASWTTSLTVDGNSAVEVAGSAGGPAVVIEGGVVTWHSTGNPGTGCVIGSNGTLDLGTAPKQLTIGGTINVYQGYTILDPAGRGGNFAIAPQHCSIQDGQLVTTNGGTWTRS